MPGCLYVSTDYCLLRASLYPLRAHVRPERFGDEDGAVLLLVVLKDREPRAADGEAGAVERVDVLGLRAARPAEAYLRAARLVRLEVRARRDFAEGVLRGQPHLQVVGLRRRAAHVAGRERDDAVVQPELLQNPLGVARQPFEFLVRVLGERELHQLDLVELVLADDAARVAAVRAGLRAEAGRVGDGLQRKLGGVEYLLAMDVRHRHLGRRDKV